MRARHLLLAGIAAAMSLAHPPAAEAQKRQRDVITREELMQSSHKNTDLYQAVRSLRAHFLAPPRGTRTLGAAPPAPTVVYVDGTRQGELDVLKNILTDQVEEVRYLEPAKAQNEYGATASGGAVLVKMLKAAPPPPATPPPPPAGRTRR